MMSLKWIKNFSRVYSNWVPPQLKKPILSQEVYNRFLQAFPLIIDKTLQETHFIKIADRVKRIVEYNIRKQDQTQGQMTIFCNEILQEPGQIRDELELKQHVLAWCTEMLFAYAVITDDFEEGSKTRYNRTCWHLLPDVGTLVINDACTILSLLYEMLRQNFEGAAYIELINLFNETILKYNIGQNLDAVASSSRNYNIFNKEHYETVAYYKLGFYSLILPVRSALVLSNKYNKDSYENVSNILSHIGIWSQINNDFRDFFDDDARTGKTGSDIQAGKCTWLAVTALQRCNNAQKKVFEECYGSLKPSHVERIRKLYNDLNLIDIYFEEEQASYDNAIKKIESLPSNGTPSRNDFKTILNRYYGNISFKVQQLS